MSDLLKNPSLVRALTPKWTKFIPHQPTPKQRAFLCLPHREAFFGGAAGGGKSDALLMCVLQYVDVPGYSALILRKTLTDLKQAGALLSRAHQWLQPWIGHGCRFVPSEHAYYFDTEDPSRPATVAFGYIGDEMAFERYQGIEIQCCCFDELTQHCVHPHTEILTDSGWKSITEVDVNDRVLSLHKDYYCDYRPVSRVMKFKYSGPIHKTRHKSLRYAVTPNHRMVIEAQKTRDWRFCLASDLPTYPRYPSTQRWEGCERTVKVFVSPVGRGHGRNSNSANQVSWLDWCEFLGWYLSEGSSFIQGPSSPVVSIRQTKPCPSLDTLMVRLPWRAKKTEGEGWRVFSRQLYDVLNPLGDTYTKRVPREILDGPVEGIERFLLAFLQGDGSRTSSGGWVVGLNNEGLIDDLQECCVKTGRVGNKTGWKSNNGGPNNREKETRLCWLGIHKPSKSKRRDNPQNQYIEFYEGDVYCLGVPETETFLMRYEGRVMWSGNSKNDYLYLFSRLRKNACRIHGSTIKVVDKVEQAIPNYVEGCRECTMQRSIPIRMRSASNPTGLGRLWVRDRFKIEPDIDPIEARKQGRKIRFIGHDPQRPFIPSFVIDNPYLNQAAYYESLDELPELERKQLKEGDWAASSDSRFQAEWMRYYTVLGDHFIMGDDYRGPTHLRSSLRRVFATVDPASSSKEGPGAADVWKDPKPSHTVISTWGLTTDFHLIWLDMVRFQKEIPDINDELLASYRKWRQSYFIIEANGLGAGVFQLAQRIGLPVKRGWRHTDKVVNATDAILRMEQGRVWMPRQAPWRKEAEDEIFTWFGHPKQPDDIVDSLADACKDVSWEAASEEVSEEHPEIVADDMPSVYVTPYDSLGFRYDQSDPGNLYIPSTT